MSVLGRLLRRALALFVDDARFALVVLCWVASCCLALGSAAVPAPVAAWSGPILFAGVAFILAAMP